MSTIIRRLRNHLLEVVVVVLVSVVTPGESIVDPSLPNIFYPFGDDVGDSISNSNNFVVVGTYAGGFPFFGVNQTALFISDNGALLFVSNSFNAVVAPYLAGTDMTKNNGRLYYRFVTDATLLTRATNDVKATFPQPCSSSFQATSAFIATWHNVTFAGGSNSTPINSFQVILITDGTSSFAMFNYGRLTWTTGTADGGDNSTGLGGDAAVAGFFTSLDGLYYDIPGSATSEVLNIYQQSNIGITGRWMFRVDQDQIEPTGCSIPICPTNATIYDDTGIIAVTDGSELQVLQGKNPDCFALYAWYFWSIDGGSGVQNDPFSFNATGSYTLPCRPAIDGQTCANSNVTIKIKVIACPTNTTIYDENGVVNGSNLQVLQGTTFRCSATSSPSSSYYWSLDGGVTTVKIDQYYSITELGLQTLTCQSAIDNTTLCSNHSVSISIEVIATTTAPVTTTPAMTTTASATTTAPVTTTPARTTTASATTRAPVTSARPPQVTTTRATTTTTARTTTTTDPFSVPACSRWSYYGHNKARCFPWMCLRKSRFYVMYKTRCNKQLCSFGRYRQAFPKRC